MSKLQTDVAEGDWGMKRDLYALNEKDENKCTSQESCRCWMTLVNSAPMMGKCRTPRDFHSGGPHPATLSLVAWGWLKLEFFFF